MTPPNAPRRYSNTSKVTKPITMWEFLKKRGNVRRKYLTYTPEDVEEIDCLETLEWLYEEYNPSEQPRNMDESVYLNLMCAELKKKIVHVKQSINVFGFYLLLLSLSCTSNKKFLSIS